jgi:hypothetical protein
MIEQIEGWKIPREFPRPEMADDNPVERQASCEELRARIHPLFANLPPMPTKPMAMAAVIKVED